MQKDTLQKLEKAKSITLVALIGLSSLISGVLYADEGGTSFWLPGQYGSLAAVQEEPGWSLATIYFHATLDAKGSREIPKSGKLTLGLDVLEDLLIVVPSYVFTTPVWGAQAAVSIPGVYGRVDVAVDATFTEPGGGFASGGDADSLTSAGDLYPSVSLKWNNGVHNTLGYGMLNIPVGSYDAERLSNIGSNHWAADIGVGYTYFNTDTGREFSAVLGFTYNFENPDTNYKNGIDAHLDWGASQFISDQWQLGLVGYFFNQITGDSGSGAVLGDFKSRVNGIGPQVGYLFNIGDKSAFLGLKAYREFDAKNRPADWNSWLTLSLPL